MLTTCGASISCAMRPSYEVGPRVGLCMGQEHIGQGWHLGATVGVFSAAGGALAPRPSGAEAAVRIYNTNTKKIIVSRFGMDGEESAVAGDMVLDGGAGTGAYSA
jgi:aconitate decarboxylase